MGIHLTSWPTCVVIMPEISESSLRETLLRSISEHGDGPWYPRWYADKTGTELETLYSPLNDLRIADLIRLTEWVAGLGQGYVITDRGREVLGDQAFLLQMHKGLSRAAFPAEKLEPTPGGSSFGSSLGSSFGSSFGASGGSTTLERGDSARDVVYGFKATPMVHALLVANILGFVVTLFFAMRDSVPVMRFLDKGDTAALSKAGAVSMVELARGEWYRLRACCFLHFGLLHVSMNMTTLYLSRRIENAWGSGRFLILYLSCGICGSVSAMIFNPGTLEAPVVLAGASGALWGVMCANLFWLFLSRAHFAPAEVQKWMAGLSYTLLLNIGVSMLPHVSMAAHLGGGIAGLIATPLLQIHRHGAPARRFSAGVLLALLPTLFLSALAIAMEKDSRLKAFVDLEKIRVEAKATFDALGK